MRNCVQRLCEVRWCAHGCVNLHFCRVFSELGWLPSKWNVPWRPWFYKENGGWWEGAQEWVSNVEMRWELRQSGAVRLHWPCELNVSEATVFYGLLLAVDLCGELPKWLLSDSSCLKSAPLWHLCTHTYKVPVWLQKTTAHSHRCRTKHSRIIIFTLSHWLTEWNAKTNKNVDHSVYSTVYTLEISDRHKHRCLFARLSSPSS